jgi:hypothetical protein
MKRYFLLSATILTLAACATIKGSESVHFSDDPHLGDTYAFAITDGYEYMYDRSEDNFSINNTGVGLYTGGFRGLFLYSSFKEAINMNYEVDDSDYRDHSYYNLRPYARWADMDLFLSGTQDYQGFRGLGNDQVGHRYNPKLITWAMNNLIPAPDDMVGDRTAQEVYDNVMYRFMRLMVESYRYLQANDLEKSTNEYLSSVKTMDGMRYLQERYDDEIPGYEQGYYSEFTPGMAMGFWMRRHVGGSMDEFWTAFETIMNVYDKEWFNS